MASLFSVERSRAAYRLDFAFYASVSAAMGLALWLGHPASTGWRLLGLALAGLALWTVVEYAVHRFVLHGLPPFKGWHAAHHLRPTARICSPTLLSAGLFAGLGLLPLWWLLGAWPACALGFGLETGYFVYSLVHHGLHHPTPARWRRSAWWAARRRAHALHHRPGDGHRAHFGVSTSVWDGVFGRLRRLPGANRLPRLTPPARGCVHWRTDGPAPGVKHAPTPDEARHATARSPREHATPQSHAPASDRRAAG
jgi:cyclopropane-fatty-acyl-phospholipid synthase